MSIYGEKGYLDFDLDDELQAYLKFNFNFEVQRPLFDITNQKNKKIYVQICTEIIR